MKLCKECGKLMGYNSYFGGYYCTSCGKLEIERKVGCSLVSTKAVRKKQASRTRSDFGKAIG